MEITKGIIKDALKCAKRDIAKKHGIKIVDWAIEGKTLAIRYKVGDNPVTLAFDVLLVTE